MKSLLALVFTWRTHTWMAVGLTTLALAGCPSANVPQEPVEEPDPSPELPIVPTPDSDPSVKEPEAFEPEPIEPIDAGPGPDDGGTRPDAGSPTDAGTPPVDAGTPPVDAGSPTDAGNPPVDAGGPVDTCSDGIRNGTEVCDGTDNPLTCRDVGFGAGTIGCKSNCEDVETAACTPLVASPIAAPGGTLGLSGSLDVTDPTFARPSETCAAGTEAGYYFDAFAIQNNSAVQQEIDIHASWADDGFLFLYRQPFDPRNATGCEDANDDDIDTSDSALTAVTIAPGQTLVIVATAYDAGSAIGNYTIDVVTRGVAASVCGNDILEAGEACDGAQFGGTTCESSGFDRGTLACVLNCQSISTANCVNDPPPPPVAIATPGNSVTLSGGLVAGDDTFVPVTETCTSAGGAADHRFDAIAMINNTGAPQTINATATWTTGDGFLSVHRDPFNAALPASSCITADDDDGSTSRSKVVDVTIAAGETIWVVPTTYTGNATIATYSIVVDTEVPSVCGNNIREADEVCDGTDLAGTTCLSSGFSAGTAGCNATCSAMDLLGCYAPEGPFAVPAGGVSDSFTGSLTASDTKFDRPNVACAAGSGAADHAYDIWEVRNNFADARTFVVNGAFTGGTGSVLRYATFDPRAPTTGCTTFTGTSLGAITLAAGASTYLVVAAATGGGTVTSYTITVTADAVPFCGDNVKNGTEVCDGADYGTATCINQGFDGGSMGCATSCTALETNQCFAFQSTTQIAPAGGSVQLNGNLDVNDPVWDRPNALCTATSLYDEHPFDAFVVENATGIDQVITLTAAWAGDGFLHLFDAFDSASPLTSCVTGDDDFGTNGSQIQNFTLPAGAQVVVVASTYAETPIGAYSITVETQPEPPLALRTTPGLSVQLRGDLTTADPTWTRPNATCTTLSSTANERYQTFRVQNTSASPLVVTLSAHWQDDGYLFVYNDGFNPATALTGCLFGDDDYTANSQPSSAQMGSLIEKITIPAGAIRTIVASSYDASPSAIGPYSIDIMTDLAATGPIVVPAATPGNAVVTTGTVGLSSTTWDAPDACSYTPTPANTTAETFFHSAFYVENTSGGEIDLDIVVSWLDEGGDGAVWAFIYTTGTDPTISGGQCIGQNDDMTSSAFSAITTYLFEDETVAIVPSSKTTSIAPGGFLLDVTTLTP